MYLRTCLPLGHISHLYVILMELPIGRTCCYAHHRVGTLYQAVSIRFSFHKFEFLANVVGEKLQKDLHISETEDPETYLVPTFFKVWVLRSSFGFMLQSMFPINSFFFFELIRIGFILYIEIC